RLFDAVTGAERARFAAFDLQIPSGVTVAVADVNGDGVPDVVAAPGAGGGPDVKVFSGASGALLRHFYAYAPGFQGGLFVAAGDVDGDGKADVVVAPGAGGGPDVKVFSGASGALLRHFFAYDPGFHGGLSVAAGDVDGDGK